MTVISSLILNNQPFLIGDTVTSISLPYDDEILANLPTLGQSKKIKTIDGDLIFGQTQKLHIISPQLAIGWTGNRDETRKFVKLLATYFKKNECNVDSLQEYLSNTSGDLNSINFRKFDIVGLIKSNDKINTFCSINISSSIRNLKCDKLDAYIGGSGSNQLKDIFLKILTSPTKASKGIAEHDESFFKILASLSGLLGDEILSGVTLKNGFGGGYEIVVPSQTGFSKFGNITYSFSVVKEIKKDEFTVSNPFLINKYEYFNDCLVIVRIHYDERISAYSRDWLIVSPITKEFSKSDFNPEALHEINLNSIYFAHIFICHSLKGDVKFLCQPEFGTKRLIDMQFDGRNLNFIRSNDWEERMSGLYQILKEEFKT